MNKTNVEQSDNTILCSTIFIDNTNDHSKYSSNCDEYDAEEQEVWFS